METEASNPQRSPMTGVWYALGAFLIWGCAPVYFKSVGRAGALEILAHRVVWSVLLLGAFTLAVRRPQAIWAELRRARRLGVYLVTSVLIAGNWLLYIWAVNTGQVVEASLGYFINPLVNVLLGVAFLRERLGRVQLAAMALAAAGVSVLVLGQGRLPWLALVLPLQFGLYGLIRKRAGFDPLVGLLLETTLLAPAALAYLAWQGAHGQLAFAAHGPGFAGLLVFAGVMTSLPLLLFLHGAQRLRLSTLGVIQYVSPTCQLLAGVLLYGEAFSAAHRLAFGLIWAGLLVYTLEALVRGGRQSGRSGRSATVAPSPPGAAPFAVGEPTAVGAAARPAASR